MRCVHDVSRTRFDSRVLFPYQDERVEEIEIQARQFILLEITSGLPDDSWEADERAAERRLRELRARVKAARVMVATTPGLGEILVSNWQRAAQFYFRFGITEPIFRGGIPSTEVAEE
ncbi:MAG: hypothetical protein WA547_04540 [Thermoplasmata archaeon]